MYITTRFFDNGKVEAKLHLEPMGDLPECTSSEQYDTYNDDVKDEAGLREWLNDLDTTVDLVPALLSGETVDISSYV